MIPDFIDMAEFTSEFNACGSCDRFINIVKFLNIETLTNGLQHAVDMSTLIVF